MSFDEIGSRSLFFADAHGDRHTRRFFLCFMICLYFLQCKKNADRLPLCLFLMQFFVL